jgi:hypothetical protein
MTTHRAPTWRSDFVFGAIDPANEQAGDDQDQCRSAEDSYLASLKIADHGNQEQGPKDSVRKFYAD